MSIFFVGGVYGAGKSTLCKSLTASLDAKHVRASELIAHIPHPNDATGKAVRDVDSNQTRVIGALNRLNHQKGHILLDGHYSVLDDNRLISPIKVEVFRAINPAALLLVEEAPEIIVNRLVRRDGKRLDIGLIELLTKAERDQAEFVSQQLELPLLRWRQEQGIAHAAEFFRRHAQVEL